MYVIFDSLTETLIGPFNDHESAQMFLLHASEDIADGGANLTIESISEPMEWVQDNQLTMAISL
jgi:hypothetical protein